MMHAQGGVAELGPWDHCRDVIVIGALRAPTGALDVLTRWPKRYAKNPPKSAVVGVIVGRDGGLCGDEQTRPWLVVMIPRRGAAEPTLGTQNV